MVDEGYVTVFDENECNIYNEKKVKIDISKKAVLKGYWCKNSVLWRIPQKDTILNENIDTIILDRPNPGEAILHIFELPSTENTIKYMHAAAGFPVRETWIRAVRAGNYETWPGLSVKSIRKYYPHDAEDTLKGRMRGQRQGFRSTR